jgi:hypothetical protein
MQARYHREITTLAIGERFSPEALAEVIRANLGLDRLAGQIGHDEYHFDRDAFRESLDFVEKNRRAVQAGLEKGDGHAARRGLGRLTHTVQDFYAHSNYVRLWLDRFPPQAAPRPEAIEALDAELLASPELRSGKLYFPLEVLYFVPGLRKWVLPRLPRDSHAWMNLDGPDREPYFSYAVQAAIQRTRTEFERTVSVLSPARLSLLTG